MGRRGLATAKVIWREMVWCTYGLNLRRDVRKPNHCQGQGWVLIVTLHGDQGQEQRFVGD